MRPTGFVRRVDSLGRIVLPMELRAKLKIKEKGLVSIHRDENLIVLEAHGGECVFCGGDGNLAEYKGYLICEGCMAEIAQRAAATV